MKTINNLLAAVALLTALVHRWCDLGDGQAVEAEKRVDGPKLIEVEKPRKGR